jgi:hypothetical protein
MDANLAKGRQHGLRWRPLGETSADLLAWITAARADGSYVDRGGAMSTAAEAELLAGQP